MNYPKRMTILGQDVEVKILPQPLYQMYTCPHCKNPNNQEAYTFPQLLDGDVECPACHCKEVQPRNNMYVFGQYLVRKNEIQNFHDDDMKQVCETSFIHETIEAINSITDLKLPHQTITTLAAAIYQAFSTGGVDFSEAA